MKCEVILLGNKMRGKTAKILFYQTLSMYAALEKSLHG